MTILITHSEPNDWSESWLGKTIELEPDAPHREDEYAVLSNWDEDLGRIWLYIKKEWTEEVENL